MATNGEFIEILSPSALKDLRTANTEITTLIANINKAGTAMQSVKTPSGSDSAVKNLTVQYDEQAKTIQNLQNQLQKLAQTKQSIIVQGSNMAKATNQQTKSTREQAVANNILRAETDRNIRANTLLAGAYAKASAQLLVLKKEAKDAAIAFGEESKQAIQAAKAASDLDNRIKSADKAVGDYQRNVGNYSNGVASGLGKAFSGLKQIAYLVPGLGIAGIFNLAFEAILPLIQKIDVFNDKLNATKETQKQLNDISSEGQKNAVEETVNLKSLLAIAKDTALSYTARMVAVKELQETYPAYFGNLEKEQILAGNTAKAEQSLTDAILSRAKANAAITKITENQAKIIDVEIKRIELRRQLTIANNQILATEKALQSSDNVSTSQGIALSQIYDKRKSLIKEINKLSGEKSEYDKINNTLTSFAIEKQKEAILLDYKQEKTTKDKNKEKKESNQIDADSIQALENTINALKKIQKETGRANYNYEILGGQVKLLQTILDGLNENLKEVEETAQGIELTDEQVYEDYFAWLKLKQATDDYIKTLSSGQLESSLNSIGLSSAKMFLDFDKNGLSTFDKLIEGADSLKEKFAITFQAIGDVAQEVFKVIQEASQENFQNEYYNLEKQRDIAILFAGESTAAKTEINKQYEAEQRKIKNREAKAQKDLALFNIGINTAQGVVAALASTPPNVPLSIAIGVIGLAQASLVASKEIPKYWKGTENHIGGAMIVNDGSGNNFREAVQTPDGKITIPTGRNVLMNAPKGTKVFDAKRTASMFDNNLNNMLSGNEIVMRGSNIDTSRLESGIMQLNETVRNKKEYYPTFDKNGFSQYVKNGNTKKQDLNNRITGTGKSV